MYMKFNIFAHYLKWHQILVKNLRKDKNFVDTEKSSRSWRNSYNFAETPLLKKNYREEKIIEDKKKSYLTKR